MMEKDGEIAGKSRYMYNDQSKEKMVKENGNYVGEAYTRKVLLGPWDFQSREVEIQRCSRP